MFAGMNLIVTLAANDDEIALGVFAAVFVVLKMVKFEDAGVVGRPTVMVPNTNATSVVVALIYCLLNRSGILQSWGSATRSFDFRTYCPTFRSGRPVKRVATKQPCSVRSSLTRRAYCLASLAT